MFHSVYLVALDSSKKLPIDVNLASQSTAFSSVYLSGSCAGKRKVYYTFGYIQHKVLYILC